MRLGTTADVMGTLCEVIAVVMIEDTAILVGMISGIAEVGMAACMGVSSIHHSERLYNYILLRVEEFNKAHSGSYIME